MTLEVGAYFPPSLPKMVPLMSPEKGLLLNVDGSHEKNKVSFSKVVSDFPLMIIGMPRIRETSGEKSLSGWFVSLLMFAPGEVKLL
jgi:hypothetical protein